MTEDFKKIIDEDIINCENEIKNGNNESLYKLHNTLISKYGKIIDGFKEELLTLFYDNDGQYKRRNIETMKQKLILFKAMEYKNCYSIDKNTEITVNNTNQLSAVFNISFDEAKKQVENMTCLKDIEIEEIHKKIDELEKIVNSSDRKTKKWDNAKEIIKWVADKGIDVGLTLLPLILKLGE